MRKSSEIEKLPAPTDILSALDELGLEYTVSGVDAKILCQFHDDHSPSCYVHLETGVFHCFVCDASGQFAKLVQRVQGTSKDRATLWCATRSFGALRPSWGDLGPSQRVDTTEQINEASLALFTDPPERELRKRGITLDAARALGILWDSEKRAWVLPMRDRKGKLSGWQWKKGHDVWNHPEGIRKAEFLFGLHALDDRKPVTGLLVESPLDVGCFWCGGFRSAFASYGVRVSGMQLDLIVRSCDELIYAGDNDEAGQEVAEALRKEFHRLPLRFYNYGDTQWKDPGEMWVHGEDILWGIKNATYSLVTRF